MTIRSALIGVTFLVVVGLFAPVATFAWIDGYYSNIGNIYGIGTAYGMPAETQMNGCAYPCYGYAPQNENTYRPYNYKYPSQQSAYQTGSFGFTSGTGYARVFDPLHDTFPAYPQQSYGTVWYPNQPDTQYGIGGSYYPSFGPSYVTGDYDMLGTPLCQWYDYNGRTPCAYDPHQWVYDQYTGSWY